MNILVTGGTGFLGSHIVRELVKRGENVIVYDITTNIDRIKDVAEKVNLVKGDITDYATLLNTIKKFEVSYVIHLASLLYESQQLPLLALRINCEGFINVLEAARIMDLDRIVWASSEAVYGPSSYYEKQPVDENAPVNPQTVYGSCKAFNEFMAKQYHDTYGIDVIGLRLTTIYGPGRYYRGFYYFAVDLIEKTAKGEPVKLDCGDLRVNWLYVKDAAKAFVHACYSKKAKHIIYNIGGEEKTVKEVAEIVKTIIPHAIIEVKDGYGSFTPRPSIDMSLSFNELDYQPSYTVRKGVQEYIDYILGYHYNT
jgi:UDP-glucose 4-epimerase